MEYKYLNFPRPNFRRENFISLNGEWDFYFEQGDVGERLPRFVSFPQNCLKINVPFCYQSELSGINIKEKYETVWYRKIINLNLNVNERAIIHFGAVDYWSKLYVNGKFVGEHKGGYTEFSFDITNFLDNGKGELVLFCNDTYELTQPRGKQKWKNEPFGCWYQEVTGIWKPVWIEIVNSIHIENFKITPKKDNVIAFEFTTNNDFKGFLNLKIELNNQQIYLCEKKFRKSNSNFEIQIENLKYWSPENPVIYEVKFELVDNKNQVLDSVGSYFGYRLIETKNRQILINKKSEFLRLVLEQGYYKGGIYTFTNEDEIINEVQLIKKLGFNGLRMHQKVEDPRFYYLCDVIGLYVWSEMPSPYEFDERTIESATREWKEIVSEHYNFPSIIVWTPINECWGVPGIRTIKYQQDFVNDLYELTKKIDESRLVLSDDGWLHCKTDLITLHNYIQDPNRFIYFINNVKQIVNENGKIDDMNDFIPFADGYKDEGQPILFTEFCGIGFNVENFKDGWGYGSSVKDTQEYIERYKGLIAAASQPDKIAGWCVTQISDVYQEVNGLVTFERKPKVDYEIFNKINSLKN